MKRNLLTVFSLVIVASMVLAACGQPATATPTAIPLYPEPTATTEPAQAATPTQAASPVPTVTLIPHNPPVAFYLAGGIFETIGNDASQTVVYDTNRNWVGVVTAGPRIKIWGEGDGTTFEVTTVTGMIEAEVKALAEQMYPNATAKFLARPGMTVEDGWSTVFPENVDSVYQPNLLLVGDVADTVTDPRLESDFTWSKIRVICFKYAEDPSNGLPAEFWRHDHSFDIIVLNHNISLPAVCGNRDDGIRSVTMIRYSLKNGSTDQTDMLALMARVQSEMMSPLVEPRSGDFSRVGVTVQDSLLGGGSFNLRFVVGQASAEWETAPSWFLNQQEP